MESESELDYYCNLTETVRFWDLLNNLPLLERGGGGGEIVKQIPKPYCFI